ncbi:MAG: tetratricopeptide repeat protein [Deltaproteobacteria bacterium]|nr:tetratricopeptide repeat protein [Deltaproteobacteria bacterium]MBW2122583.1 tetratricopeptide repeat protein [Deltaproteobacteria bacterium]
MTGERYERKLTAILSADVKGYSRLMGEDEEATIRTLTAYREVMANLIQKHRGRVVDSPGDNVLAEFKSVVDAVRCAVDIQKEIKVRNAEMQENRRMEFRIGVNLGDVIEEGERIYGDGVNIAARLEGLAEAGGVCISGTVHDSIENKLALGYEYLGEQVVKNIKRPVRAYRVLMAPEAAGSLVYRKRRDDPRHKRRATLTLVVVLVAGAAFGVFWNHFLRHSPPSKEVTPEKSPVLELPDKPSIAVLPFANMSGDPDQEYFSDGITEDLITDLSKLSGLFVIARNSVFTYKGKSVKVEEVGRELGVRYVLEGSVRKAGDQVRITAQLVDAATGGHLWAERYDGDLKDIFALQDEVTQKIVSALAVNLTQDERERLVRKHTDNLEAYDYTLRGLEYLFRFTEEANTQARKMFEKSVGLDPEYAIAYSLLGSTHLLEWSLGWSQDSQSLERAFELEQKAIGLDDSLPEPHRFLGDVYLWKKQHDRAIAEYEKAIALDPNDPDGFQGLGSILTWAGRPEESIGLVKKAIRLDPVYPVFYLFTLGHAYFLTGQYEEAVTTLRRALNLNPNFWPSHLYLAASYVELGRYEEARAEAAEVTRLSLQTSTETWKERLPYKDHGVLEHLLDSLHKAGLK